ncbi:MAG: hypothetical protein ACYDIA_12625 [Candidatus Humimicrobiaceae bacterium]
MNRKIIIIILLLVLSLFFMYPGTINAETSQITNEMFGLKKTEEKFLEEVKNSDIFRVIYLNDQNGAKGYGHAAVILVRSDGNGFYYSFDMISHDPATIAEVVASKYVNGKIDSEFLKPDEVKNFITKEGSGILPSGRRYTRFIIISVTKDEFNAMFNHAQAMVKYNNYGYYNLYCNNCNHFAQQILGAGNYSFTPESIDWLSGFRSAIGERAYILLGKEDRETIGIIPNDAYNAGVRQWSAYNGYLSGVYRAYALSIIDNVAKAAESSTTQNVITTTNQASSQVTTETTASLPAPSKPNLTSPYNWYQSIGEPPVLKWQGDSNSASYYVLVNSSNTGNIESGWINSTSWKPNLPNENYVYSWKVKAKNSQGVEGPWSDESHFSTASTNLKFEGDISFNPPSPSSADHIKIFASTTGWGGVGVTLRVSINTSPDGSSNGEWKILKELGVPKFNENDAPIWDTTGWPNGTYKIRVEAKGPNDPNWQNSSVIETTYKLINKTTNTETTITGETETTSAETTTSSSTTTTIAPVNAPPIEDLSLNPSSAQIGSTVKIHAKATWNSSFRAMRLKIDGNIVYELGSPEFNYDWNTSGCSEGNHTIRLEVAAIGDNDWRNPSAREVTCSLATAPVNAPPIEDLSLNPSSAQIGSTVKIHAKATWNSSFRAMRLKIDGNIVYELGSPEFNYDWNTSGCSEGNHTIRLEVAAIGDNDWRNPSAREVTCSLKIASPSGLSKPTLSSPENGKLISPGTDVTLQWNSVSGAVQYYVEIWGGQYGNNHNNLGGWQGGTSRHIGTMSSGNVLWRVKARDGSGNESPWSDEWNFTPQ